jgi:DNA-binding MarR family transcriptional regulator
MLSQFLMEDEHGVWLSLDLTMPQLKALFVVVCVEGAPTSHLARHLGVGVPTMTGIVDRLCAQGLVARREDADDRRVTRVVATDAGREQIERLRRYRFERFSQLVDRLNGDERATVAQAFGLLARAASRVREESTPVLVGASSTSLNQPRRDA